MGSVLDTNVYATAPQTLSCKIDKTPPIVTCEFYSSDDYFFFDDSLSGCESLDITDYTFSNASTRYIYVNGTAFSSNTNGIKLNTVRNTSRSNNYRLDCEGNGSLTLITRCHIIVHDKAGNISNAKGIGVIYQNGHRHYDL